MEQHADALNGLESREPRLDRVGAWTQVRQLEVALGVRGRLARDIGRFISGHDRRAGRDLMLWIDYRSANGTQRRLSEAT